MTGIMRRIQYEAAFKSKAALEAVKYEELYLLSN